MKKFLAALIVSVALPAAACHAHWNYCCSFGPSGTITYGFRVRICSCLQWNPGSCFSGGCKTGCGGGGCGAGCGAGGFGAGGFGGGGFGAGGTGAGGIGAAGCVAGPWYSYWPLEAHFQVPAPTGYPYWPSPMDSSVLPQQLPAYGYLPGAAPQSAPMMPGMHQQMGYFQQGPSYWYGN
jgi:hypothetical protein